MANSVSFLCASHIAVITHIAAFHHRQMLQETKCKAEQLEEMASERTVGAKKSSGCCLHPQDERTVCWEPLHSAAAFCHRCSRLVLTVGRQRSSRTRRRIRRKWDDREEALRAPWTINSPDVSLDFLHFDRNPTSGSCRCCP